MATGTVAEHLRGMPASAGYFRVLGIQPALGRGFLDEEDRGDGQRVVILSHNLWVRRFGADAQQIGQTVLLNGEPYTIVGVMPGGFDSIPPADLWIPLALVAKTAGSGENISVLARLKPGVTRAQFDAQIAIL
jgi:putative ABC transport system permease protein